MLGKGVGRLISLVEGTRHEKQHRYAHRSDTDLPMSGVENGCTGREHDPPCTVKLYFGGSCWHSLALAAVVKLLGLIV